MLTCEELTRWIASDELVEAKWSVRFRARVHLLICRHCRRYREQIRAIGAAARRSLGGGTEDPGALARLESKILDRCRGEPEDDRSS